MKLQKHFARYSSRQNLVLIDNKRRNPSMPGFQDLFRFFHIAISIGF